MYSLKVECHMYSLNLGDQNFEKKEKQVNCTFSALPHLLSNTKPQTQLCSSSPKPQT